MKWHPLAILVLGLSLLELPRVWADHTAEQTRAIVKIEKLGGTLEVDTSSPGKPVIGINLSQTKAGDADLELLDLFPELRRLDLHQTDVTDNGLTHLKTLTGCNRSFP
jgi:hypothetical protein